MGKIMVLTFKDSEEHNLEKIMAMLADEAQLHTIQRDYEKKSVIKNLL